MISNELLLKKLLQKIIFNNSYEDCCKKTIEHVNYSTEIAIPKNWELLRIGQADIYFTNGNYSSKYPKANEFVDDGIPFIRANNIKNMSIVNNGMYYITKEKHDFLSKGHLKENDILIAIRGSIGLCAIVPKFFDNANLNAQLTVLRCNSNIINPKFLLYQVASDFVQKQFSSYITGAALKQLSEANLKKCYIVIPPINIQNEIVNKIEKCLSFIEIKDNNDKEKLKLKEILKEKILDNEFDIKFPTKKIKDICELINGDRSNKYPNESDLKDKGIPFFGAKDIKGTLLSFENVRYISKEKFNSLGNGKLTENDIIILLRGSVGKTAIFKPNDLHNTGFICAQMMILRSNDIYYKYLYYFSLTTKYLKYIGEKTTGTAVKQLPAKKIGEMEVPVPPLEEQHRIVEKIEQCFELIEQL